MSVCLWFFAGLPHAHRPSPTRKFPNAAANDVREQEKRWSSIVKTPQRHL